jgi:hypothetical protein
MNADDNRMQQVLAYKFMVDELWAGALPHIAKGFCQMPSLLC